MKIEGILQRDDYFYVTFVPNWFEKYVLGLAKEVEIYRQVGTFALTNESMYVNGEGRKLGVFSTTGEAINRFKRKQLFHNKDIQLNMN